MSKLHPLKDIVRLQKQGISKGICSICSSNVYVIEAAMESALEDGSHVLIEATANQVNQFGGYTGMKPLDFKNFVYSIAEKVNFPSGRIILGGDHLGPLTWKDEASETAMRKAEELISQYVLAGFNKIHIDTSMHLGGDSREHPVDTSVIAERGAVLCRAAEEAYDELCSVDGTAIAPVYVIGSEVPIPGGSQEPEDELKVTSVQDFNNTLSEYKQVFKKNGLSRAWENVIGVVVQPGVEFGDETVHDYNREMAKDLSAAIKNLTGIVFEGHSTDYQTSKALKDMVEDGIAILKVGPELTFAVREALFLLNFIENEVLSYTKGCNNSRFIEILDDAMARNPVHWRKYYNGDEGKVKFTRKYSLSDRCRYYLAVPEVKESIDTLIGNLCSNAIPMSLISQFLPVQYAKIREGKMTNNIECLIKDKVKEILLKYSYAIG